MSCFLLLPFTRFQFRTSSLGWGQPISPYMVESESLPLGHTHRVGNILGRAYLNAKDGGPYYFRGFKIWLQNI